MTSTLDDVVAQPFPWARPPIDPPEAYQLLREEGPVVRVLSRTDEPIWLVSRYDDVRQILADPRVSSDMLKPGFPLLGTAGLTKEQVPFQRMDPPVHTIFRRLLAKHFLVKKVNEVRPRIQELVDEQITAMLASPDRRADLVEALATPVSATVLGWYLGVPAEDRRFFVKAADEALGSSNPTDPEAMARGQAAVGALFGYLAGKAAERAEQADPGSDILGALVQAAKQGEITMQDVVNTCFVLIVAGHDTTTSMTGLGTLTLLQHPEQMAELRSNPALIPNAIEEMLRYLTIVHLIVIRVATEDIEIGGVTIPAGEGIIPLNFSANRDDAHYPDAASFDVHRAARDHFAFGYGVHQCIGQALARAELEIIFETLLRRVPTLALDARPEDLDVKVWSPINGLHALPVSW